MNIIFYKLQDEVNDVKKTRTLTTTASYVPLTVQGNLKAPTSKVSPVIDFAQDITYFNGYNYAYIADFGRYYFVDDVISTRASLTTISFRVDVLTSFLTQANIGSIEGFVGRCNKSTKYDVFIPDSRIQFESKPTVTVSEPTSYVSNIENVTFNLNATDNVVVNVMNINTYPTDMATTNILVPEPLRPLVNNVQYFKQWQLHPYGTFYGYVTDYDDGMIVDSKYMSALVPLLYDVAMASTHASFISSIRVYPFSVGKGTSKEDVYLLDSTIPDIRYGTTTTALQMYPAKYTNSGFLILKDFILEISGDTNDFTRFEPYTKYELFVPYVSWVNIDLKENYGCRILVFYNVDYLSGQATAFVYNSTKNTMLLQSTVQIGVDVPVNVTNMKENEIKDQNYTRNYVIGMVSSVGAIAVGAGLTLAGGSGVPLMLGGFAGIGTSTATFVNNENLLLSKGTTDVSNSNGITGIYGGLKVLQRITKLNSVNNTSTFKSHQGVPTNKVLTLTDVIDSNNYHTYAEIVDLHTTTESGLYSLGDITYNEVEELKKLCAEGIYL